MIYLQPISEYDFNDVIAMELSAEREKSEFMDSNAKVLARCWFYREEENIFAYGVHNENEELVGFSILNQDEETGNYCIWHMMIDEKYQGKGYGRQLIETVIEIVNNDENAYNLSVYCMESDITMKNLLEGMGFENEDFNVANGELIMNLEIE